MPRAAKVSPTKLRFEAAKASAAAGNPYGTRRKSKPTGTEAAGDGGNGNGDGTDQVGGSASSSSSSSSPLLPVSVSSSSVSSTAASETTPKPSLKVTLRIPKTSTFVSTPSLPSTSTSTAPSASKKVGKRAQNRVVRFVSPPPYVPPANKPTGVLVRPKKTPGGRKRKEEAEKAAKKRKRRAEHDYKPRHMYDELLLRHLPASHRPYPRPRSPSPPIDWTPGPWVPPVTSHQLRERATRRRRGIDVADCTERTGRVVPTITIRAPSEDVDAEVDGEVVVEVEPDVEMGDGSKNEDAAESDSGSVARTVSPVDNPIDGVPSSASAQQAQAQLPSPDTSYKGLPLRVRHHLIQHTHRPISSARDELAYNIPGITSGVDRILNLRESRFIRLDDLTSGSPPEVGSPIVSESTSGSPFLRTPSPNKGSFESYELPAGTIREVAGWPVADDTIRSIPRAEYGMEMKGIANAKDKGKGRAEATMGEDGDVEMMAIDMEGVEEFDGDADVREAGRLLMALSGMRAVA